MLAERKGQETGRLRIGHAAADTFGNGAIERAVGQRRKLAGDAQQGEGSGQVADAEGERHGLFLAPQRDPDIVGAAADSAGEGQRFLALALGQQRGEIRMPVQQRGEVRGVGAGAFDRAGPVGLQLGIHAGVPAQARA